MRTSAIGKNHGNTARPVGFSPALIGADWIKGDNRAPHYSAVDLIELAVTTQSTVWIAHADRLPRPAWLTNQFTATTDQITVLGHPLTLYRYEAAANTSLTLGANTEDTRQTVGHLYIVFVNAAR